MTVLELIQKGTEFLARKNVESPRLQAELLLAHVLAEPRMRLYLQFDREVPPAQVDAARELLKRRGQREPVQQILGSTSFCGMEVAVNRNVLVPRPETELLAERAWTHLNNLTGTVASPARVLDFGTGSGCLAIAIAAKCPPCKVVAIDASAGALEVASANAVKHGLAERIELIRSENLDAVSSRAPFDLIVSNPPYIPTAEIATLEPEVRDFEPHLALDGGPDGLDFYRHFASRAAALLEPRGRIMLEFGDGQGPAISALFQAQNWIVEPLIADYTQRLRIIVARRD